MLLNPAVAEDPGGGKSRAPATTSGEPSPCASFVRERGHRGDAADGERHQWGHSETADEESQHLPHIRRGERLEQEQRDSEEKARPRHRRSEAERAERDGIRGTREPCERSREGDEPGQSPGGGHCQGDHKIRHRFKQPSQRRRQHDQAGVPTVRR